MITQEKLKRLFDYDPGTGIFTRKEQRGSEKAGDRAGTIDGKGYLHVKIDGNIYAVHRLVWLYMYGYFPENLIDHKNKIKTDNRLSNLREASKQCNARNTGNYSHSTSGVKGVYFSRNRQKWIAQIKVNGEPKYLGIYKDFEDAVCARLAAEQCLGWNGCDAKSPACKYVVENIL